MKLQDIIDAWNNQADEYNQWTELDGDEKVEFTLMYVADMNHTDEINNYITCGNAVLGGSEFKIKQDGRLGI